MTTLSTVGQIVVSGLTSESSNRTESNSTFSVPLGIAGTSISQYQLPAKELDLEILENVQPILDQINAKKSQIASICSSVMSVYIPGIRSPLCAVEPDKANLDSVVISDKDEYPAVTGGFSVGGTPNPGTPQIAYGNIRPDNIRILRYPNLENRVAPNDNALENYKFPVLTTQNAGQGKIDSFFKNSKYNDGVLTYYVTSDTGNWSSESWNSSSNVIGQYVKVTGPGIGTVGIPGAYDHPSKTFTPEPEYSTIVSGLTGITTGTFNGTSVNFNPITLKMESTGFFPLFTSISGTLVIASGLNATTIINSISTLESEIEALRVGISTWFSEVNSLKERRHGQQLRVWSYKRVQQRNSSENVNIGLGITSVERVDPRLPTTIYNFSSEDSRFDDTSITFDAN